MHNIPKHIYNLFDLGLCITDFFRQNLYGNKVIYTVHDIWSIVPMDNPFCKRSSYKRLCKSSSIKTLREILNFEIKYVGKGTPDRPINHKDDSLIKLIQSNPTRYVVMVWFTGATEEQVVAFESWLLHKVWDMGYSFTAKGSLKNEFFEKMCVVNKYKNNGFTGNYSDIIKL